MKNLKTVFTLLVAVVTVVGLSACAEGTTDGPGADTTDTAITPPSDTMGDMQDRGMQDEGTTGDSVTVQSTINTLSQGVTSIPVNAAVQNINGWQSKLEGMSQLSDLSDNLGQLKQELQADQIDGQAVGELLAQLGEQTSQAAGSASGQQMTRLQALGQTLTQAGNQLSGDGAGTGTNGSM